MGSSGSKAAKKTAGAAARKYPIRSPQAPPPTSMNNPASSTGRATAQPSRARPGAESYQPVGRRAEAIDLDARDPDFAALLRKVGPVQPAPTFSPSSTVSTSAAPAQQTPHASGQVPHPASNPAIAILAARERITQEVEQEKINASSSGFGGRKYMDVATIRRALAMRDERGMAPNEIEKALGLKKGRLAGLGRVGVVEVA